ncbi:asparagine synthase-related protein [Burkholderia theae]|uniref:asparagine synthase-related protein n=1 Tax=Burkholderia theae TaxID=3143496 RepID=UPI003AFAF52F
MNLWLKIHLPSFTVEHEGFAVKALDRATLYHSGEAEHLAAIEQLANAEYCQAVIVDADARTASFGRDYLGHYPLSFACTAQHLYISDNFARIYRALRADGVTPTLSEEAIALYFTMGFAPHGMSIFREITNCAASGYYRLYDGKVTRVSLFEPIEIGQSEALDGLRDAIECEVRRASALSDEIDVWCSGGLDSSIMATLFNADGAGANLLTLAYGREIEDELGDGERRFAEAVAAHTGVPLRGVELDCAGFAGTYQTFLRHHHMPVIDTPLVPKYQLAQSTRAVAITGEGGDNFFGGPKNATVTYAHQRQPHLSYGELYALAYHRFIGELPGILRNGEALRHYAIEYCEKLVGAYPGDLLRKLFYLNSFEKLSGLIFAESYYPGKLFGVRVRHPFASLSVYRAAFKLPDHTKFDFPKTKIALTKLYGPMLPDLIVRRKKSGTLIPLGHYLNGLDAQMFDLSALAESGLFSEALLDSIRAKAPGTLNHPLFLYSLLTLNHWIANLSKSTGD